MSMSQNRVHIKISNVRDIQAKLFMANFYAKIVALERNINGLAKLGFIYMIFQRTSKVVAQYRPNTCFQLDGDLCHIDVRKIFSFYCRRYGRKGDISFNRWEHVIK